ncbi:MAG: NADH-quinone oxidoreductase subunit L [Candidatus Ratteibacteria bacterium]|jgi:NADH:ubiquinone oxidoreductase subunit 5 (subunit L)/multisubunit Na+/H+ antiporter MnhA subunit
MAIEALVLLTIGIPVLGTLLIAPLARISYKARNSVAALLAIATAIVSLMMIPFGLSGGEATLHKDIGLGLDFVLVVDAFSIFMAVVSSFLGALITLFSLDYVKETEHQTEYYSMVLLFIGSMMGLVFSVNLIFLYLFWEIAGICSWRLIGFYRVREFVTIANKSFLITFGGAVLMLVGFFQIFQATGTFDLTLMRGFVIPSSAVLLILIGMFSKSASLPFHTWLPDAGIAPSTVTALLHAAVLVKIGVYAFGRIFVYSLGVPPVWQVLIPWLAILSSLVGAAAALVEYDIKRILAYSTISQIGYIFLGFAVLDPSGISGATFYILTHGLAKAGLFLCAGIIEHSAHKRDIRQLGGLGKKMPLTSAAFLVCALSVIGIPPFGGFFAKFLVIAGTVKAGFTSAAAFALFIAILTLLYLFRLFHAVFLGAEKEPAPKPEGSTLMVSVVVVLAILSLASGIFASYPMALVETATVEMTRCLP